MCCIKKRLKIFYKFLDIWTVYRGLVNILIFNTLQLYQSTLVNIWSYSKFDQDQDIIM